MAKAAAKKKTGKGRGAKATGAKKVAGIGGNGRNLNISDNGVNEEAVQTNFLQHRRRWVDAQSKLAIAKKHEKDIVADLKSDGFTKKQMQIADALLGSPKKEAKVVGEVKDRVQVAKWVGHAMGKNTNQLDLFADKPAGDPVQAAYDAGERAGLAGERADVPGQYSAGDVAQAWLAGHHKGQSALLQKGIKPLEEKPADAPAAGWGESKSPPFSL